MRIHLKIRANKVKIPYDHQHLLVGVIHKWLGINKEHGEMSLYSFSRLEGGSGKKDGIAFEREAMFFISAPDEEFIKRIINGIQQDSTLFSGLAVKEIIIEQTPDFSNKEFFYCASPIFIKRTIGERDKHYIYNEDEECGELMKETLLRKMSKVGLVDDDFEIFFDSSYQKSKSQKINYRGTSNRCSLCPVIIKGKPATKAFAWNVGLGNSTGIGFGAIK